MKIYIILIISILSYTSNSQTLQFQPLENDIKRNEKINSPPFYDAEFKKLYYFCSDFYNLDTLIYTTNDSIFQRFISLDVKTGNKIEFHNKKNGNDSTVFFYHGLYSNDKIFISQIKLKDSLNFSNAFLNSFITILDTNLNVVKSTKLISDANHTLSNTANFLIENDTTLVCVSNNMQTGNTAIFKHNTSTGTIVDSFVNQIVENNCIHLSKLNDTTYISVSHDYLTLLKKQLTVINSNSIQTTFLPNSVPGFFNSFFLDKNDTTFKVISTQNYPSTINDISLFQGIKSTGNYEIFKKVIHDSMYNYSVSKLTQNSFKNYDSKVKTYNYGTCTVGFGSLEPNTVAIMNFDSINNLRWKKYIGFDAYYENAMILATPDSGCLVIVNRLDVLNNAEKYDLYYIKLDKYGNQEKNYLPVSVSTFPDVAKTDLVVYPNPFTETIRFKSEKKQLFQLTIYDVSGKKMIAKTIETNQSISINNLPIGTYFYTVSVENKIIKGGVIEKISN